MGGVSSAPGVGRRRILGRAWSSGTKDLFDPFLWILGALGPSTERRLGPDGRAGPPRSPGPDRRRPRAPPGTAAAPTPTRRLGFVPAPFCRNALPTPHRRLLHPVFRNKVFHAVLSPHPVVQDASSQPRRTLGPREDWCLHRWRRRVGLPGSVGLHQSLLGLPA